MSRRARNRRRSPALRVAAGGICGVLTVLACGAPERPGALEVDRPVLRGHSEVILEPPVDGGGVVAVPAVLPGDESLGVCVAVEPSADTGTWRATLRIGGDGREAAEVGPAARVRANVCFDRALPSGLAAGEHALCARIEDTFDGRSVELPCQRFTRQADGSSRQRAGDELKRILTAGGASTAERIDELNELTRFAEREVLPLYAVRTRLIANHFYRQEGSPESLATAERRAAELPEWLDEVAATVWRAQALQDAARLHLGAGRLRDGWDQLSEAEAAYRQVADPKALSIAQQRAEWTARLGAPREGILRLREALAECELSPCEPRILTSGRGILAWLVLMDPESTAAELNEAAELLRLGLEVLDPVTERPEIANRWINLGFYEALRGHSPMAHLTKGREALSTLAEGARRRQLEAWAELVSAEYSLHAGRLVEAVALCERILSLGAPTRAANRALSIVGRAHLAAGDAAAADEVLARALLLHEHVVGDASPLIDLGPSQRADDFYRAARAAIDLGDAELAWSRLARLDRLSARRGCAAAGGAPADAGSGESAARETERAELLAQLAALELPASGVWRRARQPIRLDIQARLQELERRARRDGRAPCSQSFELQPDLDLDYRIFAVDDEVFLLRQESPDRIGLERRAPLSRLELLAALSALEKAIEDGAGDDTWRRLIDPLAVAMTPALDPLGPTTSFALYGSLQRLPLGALPLTAAQGGGWFGERTTVTVRPSTTRAVDSIPAFDPRSGLFVVDPHGNLGQARSLVELYRELFPGVGLRAGDEASVDRVEGALGEVDWLHIDAHGVYDPAFPELTRIRLADGALDFIAMANRPEPLGFANLSGCHTGRSPATADSGRYGLAGLLVSLGARWVIASRGELGDAAARQFNESFYRAVAAGASVAEAYRDAVSTVRASHPASRWATLLLLEGASRDAPARIAGTSTDTRPPPALEGKSR